jgi:hypothetical protein
MFLGVAFLTVCAGAALYCVAVAVSSKRRKTVLYTICSLAITSLALLALLITPAPGTGKVDCPGMLEAATSTDLAVTDTGDSIPDIGNCKATGRYGLLAGVVLFAGANLLVVRQLVSRSSA